MTYNLEQLLAGAAAQNLPVDEHFEIALEASTPLAENMVLDSNKYKHPTPVIALGFLGAACALAKGDGRLSLEDWMGLCQHIYERMTPVPGDPAIVSERLKKHGF